MDVEFDHLLVFVDADAVPVAALERAGLKVRPPHPHRGQGTENRSALFDDAYLELIYLTSREDAAGNALRLDRRSDWRSTGASPFGIGLRAQMTDADCAAFRPYVLRQASPGWPPLWIVPATWDDPRSPIVFVSQAWSGYPLERMRPSAWRREFLGDALEHPCGARGIRSVVLETPSLPAPLPWPNVPNVMFVESHRTRAIVEIDAPTAFEVEVLPHLVLRCIRRRFLMPRAARAAAPGAPSRPVTPVAAAGSTDAHWGVQSAPFVAVRRRKSQEPVEDAP